MKHRPRRAKRPSVLVRNKAATTESVRTEIVFNLRPKLTRNETLEGRAYKVVPMVMLTEGVHRGSSGALLYPADELGKTPQVWNMKPIVVNHPEGNGVGLSACDPEVAENYKVGMIMNTRFDDLGRLCAEAWIEEHRADKVDDRVMEAINNQEMMELSTGVFVDREGEPGEFEGEAYDAIARNYRPDHLAILPDKKGACSIADGAGFIRNQEQAEALIDELVCNFKGVDKAKSKVKAMGLSKNQRNTLFDYIKAADVVLNAKDDPKAAEASQGAVKAGAWAVVRGNKKGHQTASDAHGKASRLYAKAGNKEFSKWHAQKQADHQSWADESEDDKKKEPVKNEYSKLALLLNSIADETKVPDPSGTDALDQDQKKREKAAEGIADSTEDSDAATAQATERSNNAMTSAAAKDHKSAAIAHRYAASSHRKANGGTDNFMSKAHASAAKLHDGICKGGMCKNDLSFDDVRSQLQTKLNDSDPKCCTWVCDTFEDYCVYSQDGQLFKRSYSKAGDVVEFEGEPEAVVRVTSYEPARNQLNQNDTIMNKKQMIDDLITNHGWDKAERGFLETLSEKRVKTLQEQAIAVKNTRTAKPNAAVTTDKEDSDPDAADNQDDDRGADKTSPGVKRGKGETITNKEPKKQTVDEYIANAPAEMQEVLRNSMDSAARERNDLITAITANDASEFSEDDLKAMSIRQLRSLAKLASGGHSATDGDGRVPLFNGQGDAAPVHNGRSEGGEGSGEEPALEAPTMNFGTEKKEDAA